MLHTETVDELCEAIADRARVSGFNGCTCGCGDDEGGLDIIHGKNCRCRYCFVEDLERRIFQAVANTQIIGLQAIREAARGKLNTWPPRLST